VHAHVGSSQGGKGLLSQDKRHHGAAAVACPGSPRSNPARAVPVTATAIDEHLDTAILCAKGGAPQLFVMLMQLMVR
jgi:hypothetical protein